MNLLIISIGLAVLILGYLLYRMYHNKRAATKAVLQNYKPKFTFPIPGICDDGELVDVVLKRLDEEGDEDKTAYFRRFMGLDK